MIWLHYVLVFLIAFLLSTTEILFGKYKLNYTLLIKKPKFLILYGLFYSSIGIITLLLIDYYQLKINSIELADSPFITSIIIGLTIKSISRLNLYTITSGDKKIHVGFKQISKYFDNIALKRINDSVDDKLIEKVKETKSLINQKSNGVVDGLIKRSLPTDYPEIQKVAFMKEVSEMKDKFDKLRHFASKFGSHKLKTLRNLIDE